MARPLLSVIIPTIGRPTLERTLYAIRQQVPAHACEILVIGDTHQGTFTPALATVPPLCRHYRAHYTEHNGGMHCVGQPQRNYGMTLAQGHWLMWSQDDSIWTPTAWTAIRAAITGRPGPRICRVDTQWRFTAWADPVLLLGNLDADGLLFPNLPSRLGQFTPRYEGDYDMACQTVALWRGRVEWVPEVVAIARPSAPLDWVWALREGQGARV